LVDVRLLLSSKELRLRDAAKSRDLVHPTPSRSAVTVVGACRPAGSGPESAAASEGNAWYRRPRSWPGGIRGAPQRASLTCTPPVAPPASGGGMTECAGGS